MTELRAPAPRVAGRALIRLGLSILAALLPGAAHAQGWPGFGEALQRALQHNPELRKAGISVEIADQEQRRAMSPFLPRVDLLSSTQRIDAYGDVPGLESLLLSGRTSVNHANASLQLTQNVFNGGADRAGLLLAREKKVDAQLQNRLQIKFVAVAVLDRYHALCQARLDLRAAELQHGLRTQQLQQAKADFALGKRPALAVTEAQYELDVGELALEGKQRAYADAWRDLEQETGNGGSAPPPAGAGPDSGKPYRAVLEQLGLDGLGRISDVDRAASRVRQSGHELRRAKARFLPRIDIFVKTITAGVNGDSFRSAFEDQKKDKKYVGFSMSWNLFDGFDTSADVAAAGLRIAHAQAEQDAAQEFQRRRVAELERPLADARSDAELESKRLSLTRRKLDIAKAKLELGKTDAAGLRVIQNEVEQQELEWQKRLERLAYYEAKLLLTQGRPE